MPLQFPPQKYSKLHHLVKQYNNIPAEDNVQQLFYLQKINYTLNLLKYDEALFQWTISQEEESWQKNLARFNINVYASFFLKAYQFSQAVAEAVKGTEDYDDTAIDPNHNKKKIYQCMQQRDSLFAEGKPFDHCRSEYVKLCCTLNTVSATDGHIKTKLQRQLDKLAQVQEKIEYVIYPDKPKTSSTGYKTQPLGNHVNNYNFILMKEGWLKPYIVRVESREALGEEQKLHTHSFSQYFIEDYASFIMAFKDKESGRTVFQPVAVSQFAGQGNLKDYAKNYDLVLMSDLPKNNSDLAKASKIYLSETGDYVVRDPQGEVQRGQLGEKIDLSNLENRLKDPRLKNDILDITSKAGHTRPKSTQAKNSTATPTQVRHYFSQLVELCQDMINSGYYHPDIKLTNFLVDRNRIRISDRKAIIKQQRPKVIDIMSTPMYAPPEFNDCIIDLVIYQEFNYKKAEITEVEMESFMAYQLGMALKEFLFLSYFGEVPDNFMEHSCTVESFFKSPANAIVNYSHLIQELTREEPDQRMPISLLQELITQVLSPPEDFIKVLDEKFPLQKIGFEKDINNIDDLIKSDITGVALLKQANEIFDELDKKDPKEYRLNHYASKLANHCFQQYSKDFFNPYIEAIETAVHQYNWNQAPWYRKILQVVSFGTWQVGAQPLGEFLEELEVNLELTPEQYQLYAPQLNYISLGKSEGYSTTQVRHLKQFFDTQNEQGIQDDVQKIERLLQSDETGNTLLKKANNIFNQLEKAEHNEPRLKMLAAKLAKKCFNDSSKDFFRQYVDAIEKAVIQHDWAQAPWYRKALHIGTFGLWRVERKPVDQFLKTLTIDLPLNNQEFKQHFLQLNYISTNVFNIFGQHQVNNFTKFFIENDLGKLLSVSTVKTLTGHFSTMDQSEYSSLSATMKSNGDSAGSGPSGTVIFNYDSAGSGPSATVIFNDDSGSSDEGKKSSSHENSSVTCYGLFNTQKKELSQVSQENYDSHRSTINRGDTGPNNKPKGRPTINSSTFQPPEEEGEKASLNPQIDKSTFSSH